MKIAAVFGLREPWFGLVGQQARRGNVETGKHLLASKVSLA
jgi:hypothetical protein